MGTVDGATPNRLWTIIGTVALEDVIVALRAAGAKGDASKNVRDVGRFRCEVVAGGLTNMVWRVNDGETQRCVKLYRSTANAPDEHEYNALCLIARHLPERAPSPIAHFPAPILPAVVAEWVPGVPLNDRPVTEEEITSLTDCLAAIHDLDTDGVPPAINTPPTLAVSGVQRMLADLSCNDPLIEQALHEAASWLESRDAERIADLPPSSWGRGDPNLENILVDPDGHARVIDLELAGVTNVTFEVADMIEHLRSHQVTEAAWAPLIDRLIAPKDRLALTACRRLGAIWWLSMLVGDPRAREINGTERQLVQAERVLTHLAG